MLTRVLVSRTLAISILTTAMLAGCASEPAESGVPATERDVEAADAADAEREPLLPPSGPVATGTLVGADGSTWGAIEIAATGSGYRLTLPELRTEGDRVPHLGWSDSPVELGDCAEHGGYQELRDTERHAGVPTSYPDGDPSFWTSILVLQYPDGSVVDGCAQPILALARLEWTMPTLRPWVAPVDQGAAPGARGAVETTADGRPVYVTAAGDVWGEIAARFAVSASDLEWMNPIRPGGGAADTAYAAQILNLDPAHRGGSEQRRFR